MRKMTPTRTRLQSKMGKVSFMILDLRSERISFSSFWYDNCTLRSVGSSESPWTLNNFITALWKNLNRMISRWLFSFETIMIILHIPLLEVFFLKMIIRKNMTFGQPSYLLIRWTKIILLRNKPFKFVYPNKSLLRIEASSCENLWLLFAHRRISNKKKRK